MHPTEDPDDLPIRTVDITTDEGRRWSTAEHLAFGDGAPDDTILAIERRQAAELGQVLYGVWPARSWASPAAPVATYSSWTGSLNTGAATVPLHMVSDVSVAPTHRRRGLLRRMMTADLARAAESGLALAALTASEGAIYGRFGFGPATRLAKVEIDTARFALRAPLPCDPGHLELLPAAEAWPAVSGVFARHLASTRGAVARPPIYQDVLTGAYRPRDRGPDPRLRVAVHVGADGAPDGHAVFRSDPSADLPTLEVLDLLAEDPEVELRLWSLLVSTDLVQRVHYDDLRPDAALGWALADPRAVVTTKVYDHLWLRLLDLPAALTARRWGADGSVVLGVRDPLGHADGSWRLETSGGVASVTEAAAPATPDVVVDADTLGSLYLGDVGVATLAAAGRLGTASAETVDRLAAIADLDGAPYCATGF